MTINHEVRLNSLVAMLTTLFLLALFCGCATVSFTTTTPDGNTIEAKANSLLWDRQIKGFTFDYKAGTVTLESFDTNPDKESIAKLCDTVQALVNAIPK